MAALKTFFNPPVTDHFVSDARIRSVMVHAEVYRGYMWVYSCAFHMVKQMEKVLDDARHQEILIRGPGLGYVMPDAEIIRKTTATLRQALEEFDPNDAEMVKGRVSLPIKTARGLYNMAWLSDRLIDDVFMSIRKSEYMLWIKALKATGEVYEGPTSLQEVVDVFVAFNDLTVKQVIHPTSHKGQKLHSNWAIQP